MATAFNRLDFVASYRKHVSDLRQNDSDADSALQQAIGGEFEAMGLIECDLLISQGLPRDGFVIDIGCGSGRLAHPLSSYLEGPYLGTDVVPELLDHARKITQRPAWRFELAEGFGIQAPDDSADIVCFFSVFTHLLHEESYRYLEEAKRVIKPTGRIVFSYLEFDVPSHWAVFESNLAAIGSRQVLNQFMSNDAILAWAEHLGLQAQVWRGDIPHIPLRRPVTMENGHSYEELATLGQSVGVMYKQ